MNAFARHRRAIPPHYAGYANQNEARRDGTNSALLLGNGRSTAEIYPWHVVLEFAGELTYWRGPSPHHFITVPDNESSLLHDASEMVTYGWGMIPAAVKIGKTEWTTSLFPKDGGYVVPVKQWVRNTEGVELGDTVTVRLSLSV